MPLSCGQESYLFATFLAQKIVFGLREVIASLLRSSLQEAQLDGGLLFAPNTLVFFSSPANAGP